MPLYFHFWIPKQCILTVVAGSERITASALIHPDLTVLFPTVPGTGRSARRGLPGGEAVGRTGNPVTS